MKTLIIIPVFNEEKNIEKCLKSLLNQTHRISQITVVNDGSNDKTDDILTKISKKYGSVNYVIKNDSLPVAMPGKKIIQAFNYGLKNIEKCLKSLLNQTHRISQITVVNDGSNDNTDDILTKISKKYGSVNYVIKNDSLPVAMPGKKIIQAFNYGLKNSISDYELIGKFDADILLPHDYFKIMIQKFKKNQQLGLVSGTIAINKNEKWVVEDIYNKNHVRGGIKLYKKEAFDKTRGLVESIGWDTVDEMNLIYSNYKIKVYHKIICKQLRITGKRYSKSKFINQGRVMYLMGYDILLCLIGSFKFSIKNISLIPFFFSLYGYFSAWFNRDKKIVSNNLSKFVRSYRYKNMFKKVINKDY